MSQPSQLRNSGPFVPESAKMSEFTLRAVLLGLAMTVILGAANAYLGLRSGITIAATYPGCRHRYGGLAHLEGLYPRGKYCANRRVDRRIGRRGRMNLPRACPRSSSRMPGRRSASATLCGGNRRVLMTVGSIVGVLFVSLVRRGMVEDPELLRFRSSVAASEDPQGCGSRGAEAVKFPVLQHRHWRHRIFVGEIWPIRSRAFVRRKSDRIPRRPRALEHDRFEHWRSRGRHHFVCAMLPRSVRPISVSATYHRD